MPFSGKTTLGKLVSEYLNSSYISLDEINEARGLWGGDGISIEEWEKTHSLAMEQLENLMPSQQDVVLDDTNCFRWLRDRFRVLGAQHGYRTVIIYLDIPLSEIFNRMEENEKTKTRHRVKRDIVNEMVKTFESPQSDEIVIKYSHYQPLDEWIVQYFVKNKD